MLEQCLPYQEAHNNCQLLQLLLYFFRTSFLKKLINLFIYFWLYWVFVATCRLSLVAASGGYSLLRCMGFPLRQLFLVVEHGLQVCRLQYLWHAGSVVVAHVLQSAGLVVVAHGLSCSAVCGIFLDQDLKTCPLHWQADS